MGELSKKSSVPPSKVYWVVEGLRDKRLVDVSEEMPKIAVPRKFEPYLSKAINEKQKEISNLIESGNSIRDMIYGLRPVAMRYKDKYRVFEPKHRRRDSRTYFLR